MKPGEKHSDEARAKIVAALKNRSPETLAKISASNKGKKLSPETRAKMAEAARRRWEDKAARGQYSETQKAVQGAPEMRERASESTKRQWADPVMRERQHVARSTEEYKTRMSRVMRVVGLKRAHGDDSGDGDY